MATIALFHSVLGARQGVHDGAARLVQAGHTVHAVDQYNGRTFDDYEEASAFAEAIGYPTLMRSAFDAVSDLDDGFIAMGFSNGGGMAEYVATQREVAGVVMMSGALPLSMLGVANWPTGVPAQIHYTVNDPFRNQAWIDATAEAIRESGASLEVFDYQGAGHLFTDRSLVGEYQPADTELLWERVLRLAADVS